MLKILLAAFFEDNKNSKYLNYIKLSIGDVYFKTGNDSIAMQLYYEVNANTRQKNYAMSAIRGSTEIFQNV